MEALATRLDTGVDEDEPYIRLLVADEDRLARSLLVSCARETVDEIVVLEAEDGAEAIRLGLQQRPAIALLDVDMPRPGGLEAAMTLRELQPRMRLALQTAEPLAHRDRAVTHPLPLFSKLELDHTLAWLRAQVRWCLEAGVEREVSGKLNLRCTRCGYGALRSAAPARCPMCHAENAWIHAPWQRSARLTLA